MADELYTDLNTNLRLLGANPKKDKYVGEDEFGNKIYEHLGKAYVVSQVKPAKSIPETAKEVYEAIPPIEEWRLPTKDEVVSGTKAAVKGAVEGVYNTISAPLNPDATLGDALEAASFGATGVVSKTGREFDPSRLNMFFGPNSPKANLDLGLQAQEMVERGYSAEEIWRTTGWMDTPNGWRFEVSDDQFDINQGVDSTLFSEPAAYEEIGPDWVVKTVSPQTVEVSGNPSGMLNHPEFWDSIEAGQYEQDFYRNGRIRLGNNEYGGTFTGMGIEAKGRTKDELKSVILHEMQHFEQQSSGAASKGYSPSRAYSAIEATLDNMPREALEYLAVKSELKTVGEIVQHYDDLLTSGEELSLQDFQNLEYVLPQVDQIHNLLENLKEGLGSDFTKQLDKFSELTEGYSGKVYLDAEDGVLESKVASRETAKQLAEVNAFNTYQKNYGEAEARATQKRKDLTPAERSVRFPGKDFDIPIEKTFTEKQIKDLLREMDNGALSFHQKQPKFAEGGVVEKTDPVSGNPVPPGATAKEVRDDVDIKASEGEYIIPANVVRYLGLDKIEKMVAKAKEALHELQESGRIGGKIEDELPFDPSELEAEDVPDEPQMAMGGLVKDPNDPATEMPTTPIIDPMQNGRGGEGIRNDSGRRGPYSGDPSGWSVDALGSFATTRGSLPTRAIETGIMNMGLPLGLGRMALNRVHKDLQKSVPTAIEGVLSTGVDSQGNKITSEQRAQLEASLARMREEGDYTPGLTGGIKDGLKEKLGGGLKEALGGLFGGKDKKGKTTEKPKEKSTEKPKMSGGGLIARR